MSEALKTTRYFKRNGFKNTFYAVWERLSTKGVPYTYAAKTEEELEEERAFSRENHEIFYSILVPVYETKDDFLRAMIRSCLEQTYPAFELILADASKSDRPESIIRKYSDKRVKYIRLPENRGISENTNAALEHAEGDYCVLLDHDDTLTPDALYEVTKAIREARKNGIEPNMLFSDEDKTDIMESVYFGPHLKDKLNLDLFLSNNYICHLTTIKTELLKKLKFRDEYNGSQDYDLFLRVIGETCFEGKKRITANDERIIHIERVLYHWRCHEASTAQDPAAKEYAYSAGKRAIEDFLKEHYNGETVTELLHKGFYRVDWGENIFEKRPEVGAIGGMVIKKGKYATGILKLEGDDKPEYQGLNSHFSGYMHRAHLIQEAFALDIRTIKASPELSETLAQLLKDLEADTSEEAAWEASLAFSGELKKRGKILLFDPAYNIKF